MSCDNQPHRLKLLPVTTLDSRINNRGTTAQTSAPTISDRPDYHPRSRSQLRATGVSSTCHFPGPTHRPARIVVRRYHIHVEGNDDPLLRLAPHRNSALEVAHSNDDPQRMGQLATRISQSFPPHVFRPVGCCCRNARFDNFYDALFLPWRQPLG